MIWYGWLSLAVALVGWVGTWRRVAWSLINEFTGWERVDGSDIAFGLFLGGIFSLAWPVIVPAYLLYRSGLLVAAGDGPARSFIQPPKRERRRLRAEGMERRIRDLERQVGVR